MSSSLVVPLSALSPLSLYSFSLTLLSSSLLSLTSLFRYLSFYSHIAYLIIRCFLSALIAAVALAIYDPSTPTGPEIIPGEYIVVLKPEAKSMFFFNFFFIVLYFIS